MIKRHIYGKNSQTNRDWRACRIKYENNACLTTGFIGISTGKTVKQIGIVEVMTVIRLSGLTDN